jgi:Leucine-rich repeat (LRR) protein
MINQINFFSSLPAYIQSEILKKIIREDNSSLTLVCRVCKAWYDVIVGVTLRNDASSSLKTIWFDLKKNPPRGPIPFKDRMQTIDHLLENQSLGYNNIFKKLVQGIEQTHFIKVKFPFSEIQYEQIQAEAAKVQVQLDKSLVAIWPRIQAQLNVPMPLTSAEEVRSWLNNPENKIELDRVTTLDLSSLGLEILPPEIGSLSKLKTLELSNNGLQSLPDTIGNLSKLKELNLYGNQLQSLPDTIGNLSKLEELYLYENQLQSLPDTIENLSKLQGLLLNNNQLQSLPDTIGDLSKLKVLELKDNQLQSLPDTIEKLSALQELCLSGNPFTFIPTRVLNSSNKIFSENETVMQFKEELNFSSSFPLAKLYQE